MNGDLGKIHDKLMEMHGDIRAMAAHCEERCKHVDAELTEHDQRVTRLEVSEANTKRITGLISAVVAAFVAAVGLLVKWIGFGEAR